MERRGDRRELARDHFPEWQPPLVEPPLDLVVDLGIAELARDPVEQIELGDGTVVIEDDRSAHRLTFVTKASPIRADFLSTIEPGRRWTVPYPEAGSVPQRCEVAPAGSWSYVCVSPGSSYQE